MFDPLLWVLPHFVTHYAGQTNQGDTNDGVDVDQASISKDATSLPQRVHSLSLSTALQKSNIPDQNGASLSADPQPEKECKGGHGIRNLSKSCSQQPSPPELQPSTSHDPPQSDEIPLPVRVGKSKAKSYSRRQNNDQYNAFIEEETRYSKSEYSPGDILGEGNYGVVYLATRKSDDFKVAYKSIPKKNIRKYALESNSRLICNLRNPLVGSDEPSVAQCMSPRPPNLLLPYEVMLQMYLSRPGHENPYVPTTFDYIILKDTYVLVMEYFDEQWMDLSRYVKEKKRLDIESIRDIVKEVVKAMISLKRQGVVHKDLHAENVMYNTETQEVKLIDFGIFGIVPGWEERKSLSSKPPDSPSPVLEYEAGDDELKSMHILGELLYTIIPESDLRPDHSDDEETLPAIQKSRLRLLGRALDPGVENVYTWLRGGVLNGEADLDQRWLDGTVEHESMGTRHDNRILSSNGLADFLQVAYRQYQSTLWKYHRGRLVEVG
ncbi:hypothetical protein BASA62_006660 [Batrachochytrium salamandrivorans]|nr:hypothetical protein BASA62_006660 [Batrachochytrium salamandrivorans]